MNWTVTHSALAHGIFVFAGLLLYAGVTRAGAQRRYPSAAIAWVMAIAFMPYLGIPLFLLFGGRKIPRPAHSSDAGPPVPNPPGVPAWAAQALTAVNVAPAVQTRELALFSDGGEALRALLEVIAGAREGIDLCTFIFADDDCGRRVIAALAEKSRAGIRVRVLLDAFGCLQTPRALRHALQDAGVAVHVFMPILHNPLHGRTNLRNHRKLCLADGNRLWSGGRNLAVEYFTGAAGVRPWVDLSFVVDGPAAVQAQILFESDWSTTLPDGAHPPRLATPESERTIEGGSWLQLIPSGPDQEDDTLLAFLVAAAYRAQHRILLATPYYVPEQTLQFALYMAARRGVRVALMLPCKSNHRLADLARERDLRELVHAGAEVSLLPYMSHAKAVVIDDEVALCGSANLDGRSLYLNYEMMMAFYSRPAIDWLESWFASEMVKGSLHRGRKPAFLPDVLQGVVRAVGFQL